MGTTKVKIIDLSSEQQEVKASRKHAQKVKPEASVENPQAAEANLPAGQEEAAAEEKVQTPKSAVKKTKSAAKHNRHNGAKYKDAISKVEKDKKYTPTEALDLLEKTSYTKFDPTVEVHINVTQKNLRGSVTLPHPIGEKKEKKYLVFTEKKGLEGKNVILADDSTIDNIVTGRLKPNRDFNAVVASAKFMPQLAKVAKVLGPAGMMPNPKSGTITEDPTSLLGGGASDAYEFRSDPTAPIIHTKLGKLSEKDKVEENLKALILAIGPSKVKKATVKSTMSPGIKLDFSTI